MKFKNSEESKGRRIYGDTPDPKAPQIVGVAQDDQQTLIIRFDSKRNMLTVEWIKLERNFQFDNPSFSYLYWICSTGQHRSFALLRERLERLDPKQRSRLSLPLAPCSQAA